MTAWTIIDSDHYAESGIETLTFPGGELHVKIPDLGPDPILPVLKLRTWEDVGHAALLLDALWRQDSLRAVFPLVPYWPGARQERSDGRSPITLSVMNALLYGSRAYPMATLDFHAYSAYRMPMREFHFADLLPERRGGVAGIIAPDAGAHGRASHFRDAMYLGVPVYQCTKERDSATGRLSNYAMPKLGKPGHYIVVDDICDGGGTFNLLAEAFDADPVGKLSTLELVVSHGIFSRGLKAISPRYQWITTSESWCYPKIMESTVNKRLTVLPLDPLINKIKQGAIL